METKIEIAWAELFRLSAMLGSQALQIMEGGTFFTAKRQSQDGIWQDLHILYASLQKKLNSKKKPSKNAKGRMLPVKIGFTVPEMSLLMELIANMESRDTFWLVKTQEALDIALLPYKNTTYPHLS